MLRKRGVVGKFVEFFGPDIGAYNFVFKFGGVPPKKRVIGIGLLRVGKGEKEKIFFTAHSFNVVVDLIQGFPVALSVHDEGSPALFNILGKERQDD